MELKECYAAFGGNFDEVVGRLPSESLVERFLLKFPADGSFQGLCEAWQDQDAETAFRMAHTLKGVCQNLGITPLGEVSAALCDLLRGGSIPPEAGEMLEKVKKEYGNTLQAITAYRAAKAE
ncbi:Hpt domain-containing protein [uncultured Neglectibacter sp.]|uniref:Hpt domain-containing protein n=1 Tax=uncultured Neglectibacter sp. TaxID=1924108 RepID=UPI0034DE6C61